MFADMKDYDIKSCGFLKRDAVFFFLNNWIAWWKIKRRKEIP